MTTALKSTWSQGPYTVTGEWRGGEYVAVTLPEHIEPSLAFNYWDYKDSCPLIPFTQDAFDAEFAEDCDAWFGEPGELVKHIENGCY